MDEKKIDFSSIELNPYPKLTINLTALRNNVSQVVEKCAEKGIQVAGVVKGANGIPECIQQYAAGGVAQIASSRLEQLITSKEAGIELPTLLLRVPMQSEVEAVVRIADISLNSDEKTLEALNAAAEKFGVKHSVVIMADLGDLREGFWDKDEMVDVAVRVEKEMEHLHLMGVGVNLGCYGAIVPTEETLNELVAIAERIEERIGRELEIISGGATSTFMRVLDGDVPKRINHVRIGENILLARDLPLFYGYEQDFMRLDVFKLYAEVIEVRDKPTHPIGKVGVDAFGRQLQYEDRGIRRRGLLAVGKADIGAQEDLFPVDKGIEILGGSSDHTIIDVEDAERDLQVGDILELDVNYGSMLFATQSVNVKKEFIG